MQPSLKISFIHMRSKQQFMKWTCVAKEELERERELEHVFIVNEQVAFVRVRT